MLENKKAGIYFHIPFCKKKCFYCGFNTFVLNQIDEKSYLNRLIEDYNFNIEKLKKSKIISVYIGGGTPNILSNDFYEKLFKILPNDLQEITIELNPEFVTKENIDFYKSIGINRFSLGIQTFNDYFLKKLNRTSTSGDIYKALEILSGENLSIDLLFGYPEQTFENLTEDLNIIKNLNIKHLSIYNLTYEETSIFTHYLKTKKIKKLNETTEIKMFNYILKWAKENNFIHYEISNFAKDGYKSIHNSLYWENSPYLGIGCSAHSYYECDGEIIRSYKNNKLSGYLNDDLNKIEIKEILSQKDYLFDVFYTNFRKMKINFDDFQKETNFDLKSFIIDNFNDEIKKYVKTEKSCVKLTKKGIINSNKVFEYFFNKIM